jgi:AcrR family transcriptional regulator
MNRATEISARRRHPEGGGYPRGDEARSRILRVALETFGTRGYEGASTRTIAELSGVNAPALQYYFGGKPGLYSACADHIATTIGSRLASPLADARQALASDKSTKNIILRRLHRLLSEILDMVLGPAVEPWALFILREQAHPTSAFDRIYDEVMGPVIHTCAALIAKLADLPENDPEAAVAALALYGQITSFRFGREAVLRVLGTPDITGAHRAQIKSSLLRQLAALMP